MGVDWRTQMPTQVVACTVIFTVLFGCFNIFLSKVWPSIYLSRPDLRRLNAERMMSATHSSITTILSIYGVAVGWAAAASLPASRLSLAGFQYDAPNSAVLELSLSITNGYFLVDSAALWWCAICEGKEDWPLLLTVHHVTCFAYVGACLHLGVGAQTAAVATVMGEITNPLHNLWWISKDVPGLEDLYATLSPIFTYVYCIIRCLIAPVVSADVVYFLIGVPNAFGLEISVVFAALCVLVNAGGIMWARNLWIGYHKKFGSAKEGDKKSQAAASKATSQVPMKSNYGSTDSAQAAQS